MCPFNSSKYLNKGNRILKYLIMIKLNRTHNVVVLTPKQNHQIMIISKAKYPKKNDYSE